MNTKANLAASVAARLLARAKLTGDDYQMLLTNYCLERFLYRLAVSDRRDRFVLKGAMLLRLWSDRPYRRRWTWTCFVAATARSRRFAMTFGSS